MITFFVMWCKNIELTSLEGGRHQFRKIALLKWLFFRWNGVIPSMVIARFDETQRTISSNKRFFFGF
jgi:hypothetical protein